MHHRGFECVSLKLVAGDSDKWNQECKSLHGRRRPPYLEIFSSLFARD